MKSSSYYIPLSNGNGHAHGDGNESWTPGKTPHRKTRRKALFPLALASLLVASALLFLFSFFGDGPSPQQPTCERRVHLLLPATQASPRFCRTLASAILHGYDVSVINWGGSTHHSAKIFGTLDYLEKHTSVAGLSRNSSDPSEKDDSEEQKMMARRECQDIVVEVDAYDVLVQRPASYLIKTFEEQANNGHGGAPIVFSAEKGCHPPDEDWCNQVPDSPIPQHIYGPDTDRRPDRLELNRARWLNSGFVVGYAPDMLRLYRAAADEATRREGTFTADQSIFGPLFASNEYNVTLDYTSKMAALSFFFGDEMFFRPTYLTPRRPRLPRFPSSGEEADHQAWEVARAKVVDEHERRRSELMDQLGADAPEMRLLSPSFSDAVEEAQRLAASGQPRRERLFGDEEVPSAWHKHNIVHDTFAAFVHYNVPWKEHFDGDWQRTWWGGIAGMDIVEDVRDHVEATGRLRRADLMVPRPAARPAEGAIEGINAEGSAQGEPGEEPPGSLAFTDLCEPGWHTI